MVQGGSHAPLKRFAASRCFSRDLCETADGGMVRAMRDYAFRGDSNRGIFMQEYELFAVK